MCNSHQGLLTPCYALHERAMKNCSLWRDQPREDSTTVTDGAALSLSAAWPESNTWKRDFKADAGLPGVPGWQAHGLHIAKLVPSVTNPSPAMSRHSLVVANLMWPPARLPDGLGGQTLESSAFRGTMISPAARLAHLPARINRGWSHRFIGTF